MYSWIRITGCRSLLLTLDISKIKSVVEPSPGTEVAPIDVCLWSRNVVGLLVEVSHRLWFVTQHILKYIQVRPRIEFNRILLSIQGDIKTPNYCRFFLTHLSCDNYYIITEDVLEKRVLSNKACNPSFGLWSRNVVGLLVVCYYKYLEIYGNMACNWVQLNRVFHVKRVVGAVLRLRPAESINWFDFGSCAMVNVLYAA